MLSRFERASNPIAEVEFELCMHRDKPRVPNLPAIAVSKFELRIAERKIPIVGRGVHRIGRIARRIAHCEAIERASFYLQPATKIEWGTVEDFGSASNLLVASQSNAPSHFEESAQWWCCGFEFHTAKPAWIPLKCTMPGVMLDKEGKGIDSTGFAVQKTITRAVNSAYLECQERKFLNFLDQSVPGIAYYASSNCLPLVEFFSTCGYENIIYVSQLTSTVHCAAVGLRNGRAQVSVFAVGSAARWSAGEAVAAALIEAYAELVNAAEHHYHEIDLPEFIRLPGWLREAAPSSELRVYSEQPKRTDAQLKSLLQSAAHISRSPLIVVPRMIASQAIGTLTAVQLIQRANLDGLV